MSAPRLDSNAIPTAIPMFSGSSIQRYKFQHSTTKVEETGSRKSKMAVYNTGMHVSQLPDQIATRFQRLYLCFRVKHSNGTSIDTPQLKWKKLEVEIQNGDPYHFTAYISAPGIYGIIMAIAMFSESGIPMGQVLTPYNRIGRNRKWKIQDGGLYH